MTKTSQDTTADNTGNHSTYMIVYPNGDRDKLKVEGMNTPMAHILPMREAVASRRQGHNLKEMCAYARELAAKHKKTYIPHHMEEPDYLD